MNRTLDPRHQQIKAGTVDLTRAAGGNEAAVSYVDRYKRHQAFSEWGSVEHPDKFVPVDVAADLERVTQGHPGWPHITRILCALNGGAFVKLPEGEPTGACFHKTMGDLSKEFGDVAGHVMPALAAGAPSAATIREKGLTREVRELLTKGATLLAMLEAIEAGG